MEKQARGPAPTYGHVSSAVQLHEQHRSPASAGEVQQGAAGAEVAGRKQLYDDHFMMWVWKVEMCKRVDKHDRESCPYAHPGELARRRHPSLYQALPCPEARAKRICPRLENCNCSHSTFEYWLHPSRFKTFLCERGEACDRPICFFAHHPDELRELPQGVQRTQAAPRPAAHSGGLQQHGPGPPLAVQQGAGSSTGQQGSANSSAPYQLHLGQRRVGVQQGSAGGVWPWSMQGPGPAGSQGGAVMVRPDPHRGATVALIPAGPSVWQNNSMLQSELGEAPNLEQLCAAVARTVMQQAEQGAEQLSWQQQQRQQQQVGMGAAVAVAAQHAVPVMGMQQVLPNMAPLQLYAAPQQQYPAGQHPQQQQVMLPGGQLLYVHVQPQGNSSAVDQFSWGGTQPSG